MKCEDLLLIFICKSYSWTPTSLRIPFPIVFISRFYMNGFRPIWFCKFRQSFFCERKARILFLKFSFMTWKSALRDFGRNPKSWSFYLIVKSYLFILKNKYLDHSQHLLSTIFFQFNRKFTLTFHFYDFWASFGWIEQNRDGKIIHNQQYRDDTLDRIVEIQVLFFREWHEMK